MGYNTTVRSATGQTPYSLVYGGEAVQLVEMLYRSLRIVLEAHLPETQWAEARYQQLLSLEEERKNASYHTQIYQKRIARAFNKGVKPRSIKEGDWVLKQARPIPFDPRGKFKPN